ncbi:MAG: hypothetical protein HYZ63_03440 [Candidatus Andersenbacteria bacterium]|nr:hypothetical protein [Candidatus Andersenbacteria bacterium]
MADLKVFAEFESQPNGSLLTISELDRLPYIEGIVAMPASVHKIISSSATGSYIRGLAKTFNLPPTAASQIALQVLAVATGLKRLADLAGLLSSVLKIANDKAQAIATDIEKELFAPVMLDFNKYLQTRKTAAPQPTGGAMNVLNLKKPPSLPTQPSKPFRPTFSPAPKSGPVLGSLGTSSRPTLPKPPTSNVL